MRRFIQVMALLMLVLAGSLPAAYLGGTPMASCCGGAAESCPCRMPSRPPGPTAPCGVGLSAPVAILAAPCAILRADRTARPDEPRPVPPVLLARAAADLAAGGPSRLARPGPEAPAAMGRDRQAKLSVFRI